MEYILIALLALAVVVFFTINKRPPEATDASGRPEAEAEEHLLRVGRSFLGERLHSELKAAVARRSSEKHFGVYLQVIRKNGQNFSVLYGFIEKSGRKIPHHEGGGQFDISLVSSETPFTMILGKYAGSKKYADFEEFLQAAKSHVENVD